MFGRWPIPILLMVLTLSVQAAEPVRVSGYFSPAGRPAPKKLVFQVRRPDGSILEYFFQGPIIPSRANPRVMVFAGEATVRVIPPPRPTPQQAEANRALLVAANAARAEAGVQSLRFEPRVERAAQDWAEYCARVGKLDHFGPKGTPNEDPWTRLRAAGYPATYEDENENAAWGQRDAAEAVAGWLASPGHRVNLLNPAWTHAGSGVAAGADGRLYFVQDYVSNPPPVPSDW